eukprot:TRINITY_DN3508_c0_g1_i1.p1 TRINITY_DN3508_c0_g1~~TRINITY_DN3508_c0_g1_i1.p1  ORF type:complete len:167 (-),score=27.34 TRINITY_DN3508_c0_g1_i1:134-634(-)
MWKDLDRGFLTYPEAFAYFEDNKVAETLGLVHVDRSTFEHFLTNCSKYFPIIPDGLDILQKVKAKGYKCYVLSNFMREMFEEMSKNREEVFSLLDGKIVSGYHHCSKPDAMIYKKLLEIYNLYPHECLFLDDVEENIHGANAAGIEGILCDDHTRVIRVLQEKGVL